MKLPPLPHTVAAAGLPGDPEPLGPRDQQAGRSAALLGGPLPEPSPPLPTPGSSPRNPQISSHACPQERRARANPSSIPPSRFPMPEAVFCSMLEGMKTNQSLVRAPETQGFVKIQNVCLLIHPQNPPEHRMPKHTLPPPTAAGILKQRVLTPSRMSRGGG